MKLLAGRTFTDNRGMESANKLVVNRTAARKFGFEPAGAIGQHIYTDWQGQQFAYEIVGVIEDYHQSSLKDAIEPIMLEMPGTAGNYAYLIASVQANHLGEVVTSIQKTWKELAGSTPFEYSFLDEDIQKQYTDDHRLSGIITGFTCIAVIISCLGLYGLSSYLAERRVKEIGVRKVMGASVGQIVRLISSEFVWLVIAAIVISVPLAWYAMAAWLNGFAYRIAIDAWVFIMAGTTALVIALITVSFEAMRAAAGNPLHALRSE
jgi:putative ABC transport system permease protein